jgi:hypothetical protein
MNTSLHSEVTGREAWRSANSPSLSVSRGAASAFSRAALLFGTGAVSAST